MCLIAIAHNASERFPLVIAANRDEDYDRPTHDAHHWSDTPDVVGGRDGLYGGAWLAVRRGGRFAAVTNLRGAERRSKSRGFLVRDFVTGHATGAEYAEQIASDAEAYAGFHLLAGDVDGEIVHITPEAQQPLPSGIHAFTNAALGEQWPKSDYAVERLTNALAITRDDALVDELMRFLSTLRGTGDPTHEVFITGQRYGTRSSTVILASQTEILFAEQSYARGGALHGERRLFCLVK